MPDVRRPAKVGVKINLGFFELSGEWEPNPVERTAAWELYVELITRVSVVPMTSGDGLLREALTSLYSIFSATRDILRRHGPQVAAPKQADQYSLGFLAVTILNAQIRPVLAVWHPALSDWEARRPVDVSQVEHERNWPHAQELRDALEETRRVLTEYAATLATACGIPDLQDAIPEPPAPTTPGSEITRPARPGAAPATLSKDSTTDP